MTLSLRTLLLLFPALIVSYGLARCCAVYFFEPPPTAAAPVWFQYQRMLWEAQLNSEQCQTPYISYSEETIELFNNWATGKETVLPANFNRLALDKIGRFDLWGRPLQCFLYERDNPCAPGTKIQRLCFYSCGENGISDSKGNETDDISSWNRMSGNFYSEKYGSDDKLEIYDRERFVPVTKPGMAAMLTYLPITLGLVLGSWLFLSKLFSNEITHAANADSPS